MAPVATLLPAATGSSSINWQDIFHCTTISTGVRAKPHHHRYHQQGPSTHDWICLNEQKKTFCSGVNYYWNVSRTNAHKKKKTLTTNIPTFLFSAQHTPSWSVPCGPSEPLAPAITVHSFALLSYFTDLTDNYRPQNSTNRSIPLSPSPRLRGVSRERLSLCMPALLFQLSTHGRRLTSTRLLKTVSADRRNERGVNALTLKNLPTA